MSQGASTDRAYIVPHLRHPQQEGQSQGQQQQQQQQQRPGRSFDRNNNYRGGDRGDRGERGERGDQHYHQRQERNFGNTTGGSSETQRYRPPTFRKEQPFSKPTGPSNGKQPSHRIRITLSSPHLRNIESVTESLVNRSKTNGLTIIGPVRLPTKILKITTRKTPCGEGSKTWDRYQMRIHKRLIDLISPLETVRQIMSCALEPGVDVAVTIERDAKDKN